MAQTTATRAPDPVRADPKHYKVEFENERVRVIRVSFGPRERSPMHSHPDGVQIFLTDVHAKFTFPDGTTQDIRGNAGKTAWATAFTHEPENLENKPLELILVELK